MLHEPLLGEALSMLSQLLRQIGQEGELTMDTNQALIEAWQHWSSYSLQAHLEVHPGLQVVNSSKRMKHM